MRRADAKRRALWALLAFALPALCMLAACAATGVFPFGNRHLSISDSNGLYIDFLSYYKTLISGENDWLYSFSKGLGGEMLGFSASLLLSPFNLLVLLFPNAQLPFGILWLIVLKLGACGLSFYLALGGLQTTGARRLLLSTAYALMAYNVVYFYNFMWLDTVMLLPWVALGLRKLTRGGSPAPYMLALSLTLITNYYTGYMVCLFTVLLLTFLMAREKTARPGRAIARYLVASVLSAGLCAALLLPTLLSLRGGKADFSMSGLTWTADNDLFSLLAKLFTNAMTWDEVRHGLPNLFCGMVSLLLAAAYFANRRVGRREKLACAGLLLALLLCFHLTIPNLVFHGFNSPTQFPYRESFVFSFVLLCMAARTLSEPEGVSLRGLLMSGGALIAAALIALMRKHAFLNPVYLALDMALIAAACALFWMLRKKPRVAIACLLLLQVGNLTLNAALTLNRVFNVYYPDTAAYAAEITRTQTAVDAVKARDGGFYRLEKTYQRTHNDPFQFHYAGLSHFSSSEKQFTHTFLGRLGFRDNGNWAYYNQGSTAFADSLLGVKYILSKEPLQKSDPLLETIGEIGVYENPNALPLAFSCSRSLLDVTTEGDDPFALQNTIAYAMAGEQPYQRAEVSFADASGVAVEKDENGALTFTPKDAALGGEARFTITTGEAGLYYAYLTAPGEQVARLAVKDRELGPYFSTERWDAAQLGRMEKGETLTLTVRIYDQPVTVRDVYVYREDEEALDRVTDALRAGFGEVERESSSLLRVHVTAGENEVLCVSVPYETDWKIAVDGQEARGSPALDALLCVPLDEGEHVVTLCYQPRGLAAGAAISVVCAGLCALWWRISLKRRKKEQKI